ncbi:MAG: anhydro-N-acetylmuramic acid kinase [Candidatus Binataceae bacterium]
MSNASARAKRVRRLSEAKPAGAYPSRVQGRASAPRVRVKLTLGGARPYYAAGLMSGTSHDGVSAAIVAIDETRTVPARVLAFRTYPYPPKFRARLLAASDRALGAGEISELNFALGRAFGFATIKLAREAGFALERLSFIGSHGHTFFHLPPRRAARGQVPSTLQLGEATVIAAMTGVPVIADFRPMDIALGGEGAPLAPMAHLWMFGDPKRGRIVQNIGGIGNATYLPPAAKAGDKRLIAFDTGPGVMVLDALVNKLSNGRMRMDRGGRMAAMGRPHRGMLAELMDTAYFKRKPPKSTGREEFGPSFLERIETRARALSIPPRDLVATVTALTARSIAQACHRFIMPLGPVEQLIATGGGASNPVLMRMIASEMPEVEVLTASQAGIDGDALEAIAFVILAYQMLRGLPGNIPSVTGARSNAILGKLTLPP